MNIHLDQIDVAFAPERLPVTSDRAEVAQSQIGSVFTPHRIECVRDGALNFVHSRADLGALSFNRLGYGTALDIIAPPLPDFYLFQITLQGELEIVTQDTTVQLKTGSAFVMNPGIAYRKRWNPDSRQLIVRIPTRILERRLMNDLGWGRLATIRFRLAPAEADDSVEAFLRHVAAVCQDLSDPRGLAQRPYVADALEGAFLSALLACIPHDKTDALARPPSPAAPYYVNRAEQHMRQHLTTDVSMADLASASGVTERTLQQGFRRFRGSTPMRALQNMRLDKARDRLMHAREDSQTVTQIALECGFGHLGRFAKSYSERYGEPPSETLRRGRNARNPEEPLRQPAGAPGF